MRKFVAGVRGSDLSWTSGGERRGIPQSSEDKTIRKVTG
jgi:hypothetical protein